MSAPTPPLQHRTNLFVAHVAVLVCGFIAGFIAAYFVTRLPFDFRGELEKAQLLGIVSPAVLNGYPAVAWNTLIAGNLSYCRATTPQGSAWGAPVAVGGPNIGYYCELVVANGNPAIGYRNISLNQPEFIRATDTTGSAWGAPVDTDVAGRGLTCSTAIVNGFPAMAYSDTGGSPVYYVTATDVNGGSWGTPATLATMIVAGSLDLQVIGSVPWGQYTRTGLRRRRGYPATNRR